MSEVLKISRNSLDRSEAGTPDTGTAGPAQGHVQTQVQTHCTQVPGIAFELPSLASQG